MNSAHLKAELLSSGMDLTEQFLEHYGAPYLEKRRAYGNSDPIYLRDALLPQEVYVEPDRLIVGVNIRPGSPWLLDWRDEFGISGPEGRWVKVDFPKRPAFYDLQLDDGMRVARLVTLYGGGSLGLFIYGNCALVDMGKACQYCSIAPNHEKEVDFEKVIRPEQVEAAVAAALTDLDTPVSQVMLNGGNFKDLDRSFAYYVEVARAARRAIDRSGRDVELHLIVFPPRDLELFHELKDLDICVAMNTEVFSPELFERYCPGKHATAGQAHMQQALRRGAEILGPGHVYSIIVGGLEASEIVRDGMMRLADWAVTPVINVFHADPGTPLESHPVPAATEILALGQALQSVYRANPYMRPFYLDCGRNALDTEAYRNLF